MVALLGVHRRRLATWRDVAGSKYGEWIAEAQRTTTRNAWVVVAVATPLAVAAMFAPMVLPAALPVSFVLFPVLAVALAVGWWFASRRNNALSLRIADDLWTRDYAVLGLPPINRAIEFRLWAEKNQAPPEQLELAARGRIVSDVPKRTAGELPVALKWALWIGLLSIGLLVFSVVIPCAFAVVSLLDTGSTATTDFNSLTFGPFAVGVGAISAGGVLCFVVVLATRGNRGARNLAIRLSPLWVVGVLTGLLTGSLSSYLAVIGAAGYAGFVALLWSRAASRFILATDDVKGAMVDAVLERQRHWTTMRPGK